MASWLSDNSLCIQIIKLLTIYFILGGIFRNATLGAAPSQQTLTFCPEKVVEVHQWI